jgi:glycolate oxidase
MLVDDVCVPLARLATLVDGVAEIGSRHRLQTVCPGHAGDGNLHPTVVFDPTDADQTTRAQAVFDEIMALGLALGGTITGEHGVGLLKRDWLHRELGPEMVRLQRGLKSLFDPNSILNPGKVL